MKTNQTKIAGMFAASALIVLALCSFASALGVSYDATVHNVSPGQTLTVPLNLQNMGTSADASVSLSITRGNDIAILPVTAYVLKGNSYDTYTNVLVKIPQDAQIGSEYKVSVSVNSVGDITGKTIALGTGMGVTIPFKVVAAQNTTEQPAPVGLSNSTMGIIAVIVVLVVLWILFSLMNKKKRRK